MDTKKILASIAAVAMLGSTVSMSVSAMSETETTEAISSTEETTKNDADTEGEEFHFNARFGRYRNHWLFWFFG